MISQTIAEKVLAGGIAAAVEQNVRFEDIDGTNGGVSIVRVDGCNTSGTDANVPAHGSVCRVTYRGCLAATGAEFDRSLEGYCFSFTCGKKEVIRGWDAGIQVMHAGETALLHVKSNWGYGNEVSDDIPPNSDLMFLVKLVSFDAQSANTVHDGEAARLAEIRQKREEAKAKREADAAKRKEAKRLAAERIASKGKKKGGKKKKKKGQ